MNTLPLSLTRVVVVTELAGVNTLHTLVWVYSHKLVAADDTLVCLHYKGRNKGGGGGGGKCVWMNGCGGAMTEGQ